MSRVVGSIPFFGKPPKEYEERYFHDLVRAFTQYVDSTRNPGQGRNTFIVLTALQDSDQGLETGAVFQHGGYLKVAMAHTPHPTGLPASLSLGTVAVTIA